MRLEMVPQSATSLGKPSAMLRVKEYLKAKRDLDLYAPLYDVANRVTGAPWSECSKVAVVDTAGCNLDCFACYQLGRSEEALDVAPEHIAREFVNCADVARVWRVSGGEPMLQEDIHELMGLLRIEAGERDKIVWLNTNGTIPFHENDWATNPNVFVEVSFKGPGRSLANWAAYSGRGRTGLHEAVLDNVRAAAERGVKMLFNLWTAAPPKVRASTVRAHCAKLIKDLRAINERFPLLVTPVELEHYDWSPEWPEFRERRGLWFDEIAKVYPWEETVAPMASHLGLRTR